MQHACLYREDYIILLFCRMIVECCGVKTRQIRILRWCIIYIVYSKSKKPSNLDLLKSGRQFLLKILRYKNLEQSNKGPDSQSLKRVRFKIRRQQVPMFEWKPLEHKWFDSILNVLLLFLIVDEGLRVVADKMPKGLISKPTLKSKI